MRAWLRCRVVKGMFSDEVAVTYPGVPDRPDQVSVFLPRSCVRAQTEDQGEVMVDVIVEDGIHLARLPSEYPVVVEAEESDLRRQ